MANAYLPGDPAPNEAPSDLWMLRVLTLLERAISELEDEAGAIRPLAEAASLLRDRIDTPGGAAADTAGRGRLLAWQSRKVRDYIEAHIAEPLQVTDLCALIHRSEAHFSRSFKRTFGESPHAFLVRQRLQRAEKQMLHTDATLSDIALQCGFTDQAHLSKQFRQLTGRTPASWRRAKRAPTAGSSTQSQLSRSPTGILATA